MLGDYKISRTSRRCSVQNRPLQPGEVYYSVLIEQDEEFARTDISADAWQGPPEDCVGHWKNRVPVPGEKAKELAPPEVLIELLRSMADQPEKLNRRYLLALLLIRKRHLQLVDTKPASDNTPEILLVQVPGTDETLEIAVDGIDPEQANSLQAELIELIYRDAE